MFLKNSKYTCIFIIRNLTIAQSSYLNLDVENDLYFLTDEYYSSGIFIETGKLTELANSLHENYFSCNGLRKVLFNGE